MISFSRFISLSVKLLTEKIKFHAPERLSALSCAAISRENAQFFGSRALPWFSPYSLLYSQRCGNGARLLAPRNGAAATRNIGRVCFCIRVAMHRDRGDGTGAQYGGSRAAERTRSRGESRALIDDNRVKWPGSSAQCQCPSRQSHSSHEAVRSLRNRRRCLLDATRVLWFINRVEKKHSSYRSFACLLVSDSRILSVIAILYHCTLVEVSTFLS